MDAAMEGPAEFISQKIAEIITEIFMMTTALK